MRNKLLSLLSDRQIGNYVFVGGLVYIIEILIIFFLQALSLPTALVITVAFWVGFTLSFLLQKILTFGDKNKKSAGTQVLLYSSLVVFNYIFTLLFVYITEDVFNIYISRTLALVITTVWNFILYKKIIFNRHSVVHKKIKNTVKLVLSIDPILVITAVAVMLLTGLALTGYLARPIADDFSYFNSLQASGSVIDTTVAHYSDHNGRFSQALLTYGIFDIFGENATRITPSMLIGMLIAASSLFIYTLLPKNRNQLKTAVVFGSLFTAIVLITMPSLFDSLYWMTSATVYIPSLAGVLLSLSLIVSVAKKRQHKLLTLIFPLLALALFQTFSEGGALVSIAISALFIMWVLISIKKRAHLIKPALLVFGALIVGFLANALSPATSGKRQALETSYSVKEIVVNILTPLEKLFLYTDWWHICLALFVGVSLSLFAGMKLKLKGVHLIIIIAVLIGAIVGIFSINALTSGGTAIRVFTLPHALLISATVVIFFSATEFLKRKISSNFIIVGSFIVLLIAMPFALHKQISHIQIMGLRDSLSSQRMQSIKNQLESGNETVSIDALPILIGPSDATDLYPTPEEQVDWFVGSIRNYYGINTATQVEVHKNHAYCWDDTLEISDKKYLCN